MIVFKSNHLRNIQVYTVTEIYKSMLYLLHNVAFSLSASVYVHLCMDNFNLTIKYTWLAKRRQLLLTEKDYWNMLHQLLIFCILLHQFCIFLTFNFSTLLRKAEKNETLIILYKSYIFSNRPL